MNTHNTIKGEGIKQYNNVIVSFFFVHGVSGIVAMLVIALFLLYNIHEINILLFDFRQLIWFP